MSAAVCELSSRWFCKSPRTRSAELGEGVSGMKIASPNIRSPPGAQRGLLQKDTAEPRTIHGAEGADTQAQIDHRRGAAKRGLQWIFQGAKIAPTNPYLCRKLLALTDEPRDDDSAR